MAFPAYANEESKKASKESLSIKLFGNRIYSGQTFGEYLLEFLIVFSAAKSIAKDGDTDGRFCFHTAEQIDSGTLNYYTVPRVGLKRFVFYSRSKQDSHTYCDDIAYDEIMAMLKGKCPDPDWPYILQDLLFGYALVLKKRGWYAQSLLPIAPELLFPETQGISARKAKQDMSKLSRETEFDYGSHDFLARGGELYYLQLLEGLYRHPEADKYREQIECGIRNMLCAKSTGFSTIASKLQEWWLNYEGISKDEPTLTRKMNMGYIETGVGRRSHYSLEELECFLRNELHPVQRIELMSIGVVLTLLRCMHLQAYYTVYPDSTHDPSWIIDMHSGSATSNVAKLSARSYRRAYAEFGNALNKLALSSGSANEEERFTKVSEGLKHSADVFKRLGKEMQLVIPSRGAYERFSLSEDIVRYLVLSLLPPKKKMTFDSFLEMIYQHFGMVIGPDQYSGEDAEAGMYGYLVDNKNRFQEFLKNCGMLRDLSDATSIVENPYAEVTEL